MEGANSISMIICLSNAHTSYAVGARNKRLGLNEYEYSVSVNEIIESKLVASDIQVHVIDGSSVRPYNKSINHKVKLVNYHEPALAIENHLNGSKNNSASGFEVLFYPSSPKGEKIANTILAEFDDVLPFVNNGLKGKPDLAFLRDTKCPAVITEPLFVTTRHNAYYLKTERGIERIAECIAKAIIWCKDFLDQP